MTRPSTIFFDMDETLVENTIPFLELFSQLYHSFDDQLGTENFSPFIKQFKHDAPLLWQSMFNSSESPESQLTACYERCILATKSVKQGKARAIATQMFDRFLDLSSSQVRYNPHAQTTLLKLRELGITTGLITNGIEAIQMGKVQAVGLDQKVDSVTVSAQARMHKPHAPVFELALSRAKAQAENAWQVGDHATNDVAGGIRAGLGGIYYNPKKLSIEQEFSELNERPTHSISGLDEIISLLES